MVPPKDLIVPRLEANPKDSIGLEFEGSCLLMASTLLSHGNKKDPDGSEAPNVGTLARILHEFLS